MRVKAPHDVIDYTLFSDLFLLGPSKAQRTQLRIVEGAIKNFSTLGIDQTTYETLAKTSKVSRTLIHRYFPTKEVIFTLAVKYIRGCFQKLAVDAINKETRIDRQLLAYIDSTFEWIKMRPDHVKVWLLFFYFCGLKQEYKKLNSDLVDKGHQRIASLIEVGNKQKIFHCKTPFLAAKTIQNLMTGSLLAIVTESSPIDSKKMQEITSLACLELVGFNSA